MIYLLQRVEPHHDKVARLVDAASPVGVAISQLVIAEALVGVLRKGNPQLLEAFEDFFADVTVLDLDQAVFRKAASIRAATGLKLPDALHVACAIQHGCESLWTNDDRLNAAAPGLAHQL